MLQYRCVARICWEVDLDTAERAVDARRQFVHFLRRHGKRPAQVFDAEVVVGELLANIVQHEPGNAKIVVDVAGDEAIVTLEGPGPTGDEPAFLPEGLAEHGRGLYLVRALARDYYRDRTPRGLRTTVVLALRGTHPA